MPAPNMAPVVGRFAFPVTRRRRGAPTINAAGLRVLGAATETEVRAFVHGEPGDTQGQAPEGQSVAAKVHGYSRDDWRLADETTGTPADEVLYAGRWYRLDWLRDWASGTAGARTWREWTAVLVVYDETEPEEP